MEEDVAEVEVCMEEMVVAKEEKGGVEKGGRAAARTVEAADFCRAARVVVTGVVVTDWVEVVGKVVVTEVLAKRADAEDLEGAQVARVDSESHRAILWR